MNPSTFLPNSGARATAARRIGLASALALAGLAPALRAGNASIQQSSAREAATPAADVIVDAAERAELGDAALALLELAWRSASTFPDGDQVRNRCASQETVVLAALELDLLERAAGWAERIEDWRRGTAFAACAAEYARRGDAESAEALVGRADEVARWPLERFQQEWRRDRVRAEIASALMLLGERRRAAEYEAGAVDSEAGRAGVAAMRVIDADSFPATLRDLGEIMENGTLDRGRHALDACAVLYDRFYDDLERREQIKERVDAVLNRFPLQVGIDHTLALADSALAHGDLETARTHVDAAQQGSETTQWTTEVYVPLIARLAIARARTGDPERARRQCDTALARFTQDKGEIPDVFRPETLVPLAEAYHAIGDAARAAEVYALAVREGSRNPNARPRAEDLTAIACSMALEGFAPDTELWARMNEVSDGLVAPW